MGRIESMLTALGRDAETGNDVSAKLRQKIEVARSVGIDPDEIADAVLYELFFHLAHSSRCIYLTTAERVWHAEHIWRAGRSGQDALAC